MIACNESKSEREMDKYLRKVWQFSNISGWGVYQEQDKFKVTIGANDLTEKFTVDLADHLLKFPHTGDKESLDRCE